MALYDFSKSPSIQARLGRLEDALPYQIRSGSYAASRGAFSTMISDGLSSGLVNPQTGILSVGSVPPSVNNACFAATATTTSITWYWDGTNGSSVPVIRRADGTRVTVPGGSLVVSSLTPNTWYGFLPYWSVSNQCTVGWVVGTAGSPLIGFPGGTGAGFVATASSAAQADAAVQQTLLGREQLSSGYMTFQTPNAGTSSGGASGGGAEGRCVMLGTDIETLGDAPYNTEHHPQHEWFRIVTQSGRSLNATPDHTIYEADRFKVRQDSIKVGDWVITVCGEERVVEAHPFTRLCSKVYVKMDYGHLFWANGFLNHNVKNQYS